MVPLGEVATIERRGIVAENITSGTTYVGLEHIRSGGSFAGVVTVSVGELASSKFCFSSEHLLYGKLRPYLAKIALPTFGGVCSTDILPIRPGPNLDRRYLAHFLRQPHQVTLANSLATGANLPRLSPNSLGNIRVPVPSLDEQRRIAAILDKADALRAKRREALTHLDALTQSIFHDMFPVGGSTSVTLAEACSLITDGTHQTPTYAEAGVKFLSAKNVTKGHIDWSAIKYIPASLHAQLHKRLAPKRGDILLAKNGTTGVCAVVEGDEIFDIYVSLALLRPRSGFASMFLVAAINSPRSKRQFNRTLKGIGVPNLHLKDIRATTIPNPPGTLQQTFATRIAAVERLKDHHRVQLAELNALFASIQHRAFNGTL